MARTIGITFEDGSDHIFENVPDDITPDQVEERVRTKFPDKQIYNIDGQGKLIHWYNDPRTERKQPTAGEMLSGAVSAAGEDISNIASGIYEAGKQEFAEEGERISQAYEQGGVLGAAGQVGQTAVDVALKDIAAPLAGFVVDTADAIVGGANLLSDIYSQSSAAQDLPRLPNGQIDINSPEYQAFARNYEVPTYQENIVGQYLGSTEGYQQGLEDTGIVSEVDRPVMGLIGTVAPAIATGGAAVAPTIGRVATGTGRAVVSGAQATGRGAQTVGRVAKDQLTGENLRYRALDAASMAAGSPVPAGAAIQALKTEGIAGALPAAGRVVGGAKGEAAGRVAQQALRGSAKQVDEAVPTSPVKPTTTPKADEAVKPTAPSPVASIEESVNRVRQSMPNATPKQAQAVVLETRAAAIKAQAKADGVVLPKGYEKTQAQRELDEFVAAQSTTKPAAVAETPKPVVEPTPAPVAQAPKPAISPEAEARLAEIGSRPKIGETPKPVKPVETLDDITITKTATANQATSNPFRQEIDDAINARVANDASLTRYTDEYVIPEKIAPQIDDFVSGSSQQTIAYGPAGTGKSSMADYWVAQNPKGRVEFITKQTTPAELRQMGQTSALNEKTLFLVDEADTLSKAQYEALSEITTLPNTQTLYTTNNIAKVPSAIRTISTNQIEVSTVLSPAQKEAFGLSLASRYGVQKSADEIAEIARKGSNFRDIRNAVLEGTPTKGQSIFGVDRNFDALTSLPQNVRRNLEKFENNQTSKNMIVFDKSVVNDKLVKELSQVYGAPMRPQDIGGIVSYRTTNGQTFLVNIASEADAKHLSALKGLIEKQNQSKSPVRLIVVDYKGLTDNAIYSRAYKVDDTFVKGGGTLTEKVAEAAPEVAAAEKQAATTAQFNLLFGE